jgi:putative SOS response-associated peptidase YedK
MCGRYSHDLTWAEIHQLSGLAFPVPFDDPEPNFNTAPTHQVPVVLTDQRRIWGEYARWDFIPPWFSADLTEKRFSTFNARSEDLLERKAYRGSAVRHRCLIPIRSFYEWDRQNPKDKRPYAIGVRGDSGFSPALVAGVWSHWRGTSKAVETEFFTVSMLTRAAGPHMARIHNREPAILTNEEIGSWLNSPLEYALKQLRAPFPSQLLTAWPVSTEVNKVANTGRKLMEPIGEVLF